MSYLHVSCAADDASIGVDLVPSTIPEDWTGSASVACQTSLDDANAILGGLDALLQTAMDSVLTYQSYGADLYGGTQCEVVP